MTIRLTGLALASGFGWYSLSGILMTEAYGPVMGSAAFFNDLLRELAAVLLIPVLMTRYRSVGLGLSASLADWRKRLDSEEAEGQGSSNGGNGGGSGSAGGNGGEGREEEGRDVHLGDRDG